MTVSYTGLLVRQNGTLRIPWMMQSQAAPLSPRSENGRSGKCRRGRLKLLRNA
jgi:hypothetical protein